MTAHTHSHPSVSSFPHPTPSTTASGGITDQQLRNRLLALPFPEFARCLARLLSRMGYEQVQLMGVTQGRGRNAYGGFDLQASARHGLTRSLLLAQVKQYRHPVPRSFVDELRGAMLRLGAQQGLLLTTASFSPAAREAAASGQHTLPVRLVDGEELVRLLLEYNVPVKSQTPVPAAGPHAAPALSSGCEPSSTPSAPLEMLVSTPPPQQSGMTIMLTVGVPEEEGGKRSRR